MGVDTLIRLPADVRIDDVTTVIGVLSGLPIKKVSLSDGAWGVRVDGATAEGITNIPSCATIKLHGDLVDGEQDHHVMFHYEPDNDTGRLIMPRSTAFWISVGRRLIRFFGGTLTYSDCAGGIDERAKKPRKSNNPTDGKPWQDFQQAIVDLKPIEKPELEAADKVASYKTKP